MIELCRLFPAAFAVTASAVAPQRLFVLVVSFMARIAISTQLDAIEISFVAISTWRCAMLSTQYVFGINVMVEGRRLPCLGAVTAFTFLTKLPLVSFLVIIFSMAADAGSGRVLVITGFVATAALHINVLACQ